MRVLVITDGADAAASVSDLVVSLGFECELTSVDSIATVLSPSKRVLHDVAIIVMPDDPSRGLDLLRHVRKGSPAFIVAVGPVSDPKFILNVLREGADEYIDDSELELERELDTTLARVRQRLRQDDDGKVTSVLGASGGCGASTIAANLAVGLAQLHKRCALIDLALVSGDQASLFNLKPTHTLANVCPVHNRLDSRMLRNSAIDHKSGVSLLAGPDSFDQIGQVTPPGVCRVLDVARATFPHVVVDLGRTFSNEQIPGITRADMLLVVLRLDMSSLRNALRLLDLLDNHGVAESRLRVVVNRYRQPKELSADKAEEALGIKLFHHIPDDPATVNIANIKGVPVVIERPRTRVARSLNQLARALDGLQATRQAHNAHGRDASFSTNGRKRSMAAL